jgi:diadenosine tetraphosphate (Ap4A) HIT family hydrolase
MPESAEEVHARVVAAVGEDGRLPTPSLADWDAFPWEVVDGTIVPKVLPAPADEEPRAGEAGKPCPTCERDPALDIWENDRWVVTRMAQPGGLPMTLFLQSKEHQDFSEMDDDTASEYGRIAVWLSRIMCHLPHVGRVHVNRWGDGSSHLHVWFIARTKGQTGIKGSYAAEWDHILPAVPEDVWRADLHTIAEKLANHDGRALV